MNRSGERIRQLRIQNGYTQERLAETLKIDQSFLSRIESGSKGCSVDLFVQLSEIFHVCENCGARMKVKDDDLLTEVERQIEAYTPPAPEIAPYEPSAGAVRLTNAINRGLEKPDQPEEIVKLILQGVSARYDCFQQERILFNLHGGKAVQYITIAADNAVTVTFKG